MSVVSHLPSLHSARVMPHVPQEHVVPTGLQELPSWGGVSGQSGEGGDLHAHSWD